MGGVEYVCCKLNQSGEDDEEWLLLAPVNLDIQNVPENKTCASSTDTQHDIAQPDTPTTMALFTLLEGENIIVTEDAVFLEISSSVESTWLTLDRYASSESASTEGTVCITNYQVVFVPKNDKPHHIPLCVIGAILLMPSRDESSGHVSFQLKCKDWRLVTFTFVDTFLCNKIHQQLTKLAFMSMDDILSFCLTNSHYVDDTECVIMQEYKRQGLSSEWRISHINQDYSAIPSYPARLIVPSSIDDEVLRKATAFRSNGRIPTVCWVSPEGVVIARSSQPLVGLWAARSEEDETLVRAIFRNNLYFADNPMYIVDCRPKLSAVGNMAKGLGYERVDCYTENCEILWMGVDNIHAMRDSFRHMYKLCLGNQSDHRWLSNLEYTKWIDHLHLVISSATKVSEMVQNKSSVLIHCSDGWDRTPQLVSLAMLLLDPYYRTIKGFVSLIEKEWVSFGHKFQLRSGHCVHDFWNNEQCSPIFLQWLDCVWQITQQFPQRFEFNDKFLIDMMDNVYSCRFGEFLYNNEKERALSHSRQNTRFGSLWEYFESNLVIFLNPFYDPGGVPVLSPDSSPKMLRFWTGYYLRYYQALDEGMNHIQQQGRVMKDECSRLENELRLLRERLEKEEKKRESLEHKLSSAEHETEELRKRTVECKTMMMEEGDGKAWCKVDLDYLGLTAMKKLQFDIIEDYSPIDGTSPYKLGPSQKQALTRKRSCP